jgi:Ca2+-binding RTX toxin-like protein
VGIIYNANTVNIAPGTTVETLTDSDLAALGLDFGNPVFDGPGTSRAPLAVTFEELATGETFTVTVNHFKSKGSVSPFGDNQGIGDGTGNNNEARLQAAIALDAWLDTDPTGSGDEDFLIIGDLNAYAMEDPIQYLLDEGYEDQVQRFLEPGEFEYSFGFPLDLGTSPQVQSFGALDYALASNSMAAQVTGAAEWHINADEASVFDYNTNFKPPEQIDGLYDETPFRASDHDPVIIGLDLAPSANIIDGTADRDILVGTNEADIITGFGNRDLLFGRGGADIFRYTSPVDAGDRIFGFEVGIDLIDVSTLLESIGYAGADPFADGVIGVTSVRGNTLVTLDADGAAGPGRATGYITVAGVTVTDLNTPDNFILA